MRGNKEASSTFNLLSQKSIEERDDHIIISIEIHDYPELQIILHGLNKEVEILEPLDMRRRFKESLEIVVGKYEGD